tara:strand:- start:184 stop:801 length:618 start_codon:yes stop_codon:yes gene_type:complete
MRLSKKVYILNYGLNNVRSLYSAFIEIGADPIIVDDWKEIVKSDYLVIPGVGAFSKGIKNLKKFGYFDEILNFKTKSKPLLGICLGMQMLFDQSEEFGISNGIGLIEGIVKKLPHDQNMKLPNVGWYKLETMKDNFNEIEDNSKFYFNHGYYCDPKDEEIILSKTNYGNFEFCSSIKKNNIMGSQFHPEKSSFSGMNFLKFFINQ